MVILHQPPLKVLDRFFHLVQEMFSLNIATISFLRRLSPRQNRLATFGTITGRFRAG